MLDEPIVVSGLGGSGTRLLAKLLIEHNVYMGEVFNKANDNLWFVFWMRHCKPFSGDKETLDNLKLFVKRMQLNQDWNTHDVEMTQNYFTKLLLESPGLLNAKLFMDAYESLIVEAPKREFNSFWGWKNPPNIIFAKEIFHVFPMAKFIYLQRNPLDMAYSKNKNQLQKYGRYFGLDSKDLTPKNQLKYWLAVHDYVTELNKEHSIMIVDYDKLIFRDNKEIEKLINFVGIEFSDEKLTGLIKIPDSLGRFRKSSLDDFDIVDLKKLEILGFDLI